MRPHQLSLITAERYYRYNLDETNEIIWASERDGWNHLYLYDSGTGSVKESDH